MPNRIEASQQWHPSALPAAFAGEREAKSVQRQKLQASRLEVESVSESRTTYVDRSPFCRVLAIELVLWALIRTSAQNPTSETGVSRCPPESTLAN
jgi:hypothetical protein